MSDRIEIVAVLVQGVGFVLLLVGLPLLGIVIDGKDLGPYLEFPPQTRYVPHAGFSWPWFAFFTAADLLLMGALLWAVRCGYRHRPQADENSLAKGTFPWWGWAGLTLCLLAWLMAWRRFAWFWLFQPHTFLPIWAGFILFLNAFSVKRSGSCLLLRRPLRFLLLFPASAGFWWFFEYLNRFVQNWFYTGVESMGPGEYTYYASLSFATVLPGVMSMIDLLLTIPALGQGLARCRGIRLPVSRTFPLIALIAAGIGLILIGIYPDQLFALLWVSPLIIVLSIQGVAGQATLFHPIRQGDWRPVVVPALAGLICGFFWEMWNYFSLARWTYTIPLVQRFHLFAMPILGYGGYLPFGLECLIAGRLVIGDPFPRQDPAWLDKR